MYDVTAIGELLIDFAALETGEDGCPVMKANPGGAPGNLLAALSAYGCKTAFIGKVGDDMFGRMLRKTVRDAGIETRGIVTDPEVFTTLAFVSFDGHGERSFSFARKPGADTRLRWDEVDTSLIDRSRVLHFGTLSLTDEPARTATRRAVACARESGKLISCDPNLRRALWRGEDEARQQILWSLTQADIVKISDEELDFIWGCTPEQGADRLLGECGVSLAMVTLGPRGCLLANSRARFSCACPAVTPRDTTGAGDIFGGAALSRLLGLRKEPDKLGSADLEQIARFAVTAASLSTEKSGGIPSIPPPETVTERMRAEQN